MAAPFVLITIDRVALIAGRQIRRWHVWSSIFLLLSTVLLTPVNGRAAPMTVEQAVEEAIANNPEFLSARQQLSVAQGRLMKAKYWNQFNPTLEGGATQWRLPGTGRLAEPSAGVSLEVEVGGQRAKRIEEAEQNLAKVRAQVADGQRTLTAQVQNSFYRALFAGERLALSNRIEALNRKLKDAAETRFKTGEGNKMEANLEAIRYDQSRRNSLLADRDYQNSLRELQRSIGVEGRVAIEPSGAFTQVQPRSFDSDTLLKLSLANRPDLRASDSEIARVEADTALTKRSIIPNPVISGLYQQEPESIAPRRDFQIAGGSVGIAIPIFDHKQAELTALAGDRLRASYDRRAVLLSIATQVRNAAANYDAAKEAVQMFQSDTIGRVEENFRFIETAYRAGKINLLQLVVVQNDLVNAELSYLDSLAEFWTSWVGLEYAVGTNLERVARP